MINIKRAEHSLKTTCPPRIGVGDPTCTVQIEFLKKTTTSEGKSSRLVITAGIFATPPRPKFIVDIKMVSTRNDECEPSASWTSSMDWEAHVAAVQTLALLTRCLPTKRRRDWGFSPGAKSKTLASAVVHTVRLEFAGVQTVWAERLDPLACTPDEETGRARPSRPQTVRSAKIVWGDADSPSDAAFEGVHTGRGDWGDCEQPGQPPPHIVKRRPSVTARTSSGNSLPDSGTRASKWAPKNRKR